MRNIKEELDGMWFGNEKTFLERAKHKLSAFENGRYFMSAFNGKGIAVKENGKIRIATSADLNEINEEINKLKVKICK